MSPFGDLLHHAVSRWETNDVLTATTWLAVAAVVFTDLRVEDRRDPDGSAVRRREAATAVRMALGALLVGMIYTVLFARLWSFVGHGAPQVLRTFWAKQPAVAFTAAFVAWDLSGYVYHVIGHRSAVGWAAHQAHHSGTDYNASLALRLSWTPFHGLAHHPLLALLGFEFRTVLACIALSNLCQALQHCATPVGVPAPLRAMFITPSAHRHHHGAGGASVNLGPVLTVWDRIAGTYRSGEQPSAAIAPTRRDAGALRTEVAGWIALATRPRTASPRRRTQLP